MAIDYDKLMAWPFEDVRHRYTQRDTMLYALGIGLGADPVDETIAMKHLIHKIHRGEALEHHPYIVYGFGAAPVNFTAFEIRLITTWMRRSRSPVTTGRSGATSFTSRMFASTTAMITTSSAKPTRHERYVVTKPPSSGPTAAAIAAAAPTRA